MDASTLQLIAAGLAVVLSIFAVLGILVRVVLMPYLREHLIAPVKETNKQVTENHHSNEHPTVLDRIDDVHQEVVTLARAFEGHLERYANYTALSEREFELTRREIALVRREHGFPPAD